MSSDDDIPLSSDEDFVDKMEDEPEESETEDI